MGAFVSYCGEMHGEMTAPGQELCSKQNYQRGGGVPHGVNSLLGGYGCNILFRLACKVVALASDTYICREKTSRAPSAKGSVDVEYICTKRVHTVGGPKDKRGYDISAKTPSDQLC